MISGTPDNAIQERCDYLADFWDPLPNWFRNVITRYKDVIFNFFQHETFLVMQYKKDVITLLISETPFWSCNTWKMWLLNRCYPKVFCISELSRYFCISICRNSQIFPAGKKFLFYSISHAFQTGFEMTRLYTFHTQALWCHFHRVEPL